jgi:hypothetical protein
LNCSGFGTIRPPLLQLVVHDRSGYDVDFPQRRHRKSANLRWRGQFHIIRLVLLHYFVVVRLYSQLFVRLVHSLQFTFDNDVCWTDQGRFLDVLNNSSSLLELVCHICGNDLQWWLHFFMGQLYWSEHQCDRQHIVYLRDIPAQSYQPKSTDHSESERKREANSVESGYHERASYFHMSTLFFFCTIKSVFVILIRFMCSHFLINSTKCLTNEFWIDTLFLTNF